MSEQYGYGNQQNPYDQRGQGYGGQQQQNPYAGQGGYGQQQNPYAGGGGNSRYGNNNNSSMDGGYAGSNVEMAPLAQNAGSMAGNDGNAILNECRDIDTGISQIERNLEQLRMLQQRTLDDADSSSSSAANRQLDALSSETMAQYRELTERVRTVKSSPEANTPKNKPQVGRVDRRLKQAIQQYQQVESGFRKRTQDQMARQYRIVRPDASEQEVRAAVEDTSNTQVFSQALMQSGRQGQARAALSAVQDRHKALVKIEQQMVELSQLFQDMDTLVVQQEAAVMQIEQKGEEVVENLDKGNEEMGVAVNTARKTRKKKWICLGICVAILVVIVIIVLIYIFVIRGQNSGGNNNNNGGKRAVEITARALLPNIEARVADGQAGMSQLARLLQDRVHVPQIARQ
ncbi:syntaxin [Cordyceps fumosorosea ARSEF 2679]|uniref:Syntaxin n=1 Tax=Cordyceps fumosorosea (strain ARSEF 2679) TaxID=1081104 RepID=A0A168EIT3_CORFA|nr:syntaxin [Cordyceps fumosorosea ARSEF 2679]OAA73860.1 syntaxin [Cordyceps fumosorosea ARSEF 2679]